MRKLSQFLGFLVVSITIAYGAVAEKNDRDYFAREQAQQVETPFTGNVVFEGEKETSMGFQQFTPTQPSPKTFDSQQTYAVRSGRLLIYSQPNTNSDVLGALNRGDLIKLENGQSHGKFIELADFQTEEAIERSSSGYYVGHEYIQPLHQTTEVKKSSYFMIQNVASEKIRVYKKSCDSGACRHHLVLEADAAVGEPGEQATNVGYYHITSWAKFYQDYAGLYPSWYDPNYPTLPEPGAGLLTWTDESLLPYEEASVRGAFGWYTLKVGPNSDYQWTHGTIGWGADKKKFIEVTRGFWANLFTDPRSHGCTRTDNETIAYIRELLPVGAPIIKVYAKEAYGNDSRSNYSHHKKTWNYILTKNGVRKNGQKADRQGVIRADTPRSRWLEEGQYKIDAYPNAELFLNGSRGAKSGKNGNVYSLQHDEMVGVLLVDEGRLVGYKHPFQVKKGGYSQQKLPQFVKAPLDTPFEMPECPGELQKNPKQKYSNSKVGPPSPRVNYCKSSRPPLSSDWYY